VSDETEAGDAPPNPATDPADAAVARSAVAAGSASLFVGLLGLVPFAWVLPLLPMTRDATIWVDRSSWQHPKLHEWLVDTQHFNVGFRPVTGLSYLLNDLAGGGLLAYRITDFGLHLAVVLLVHGLVRSWAPRRTPWAATAAAAVVALHPMVGIVVPHLARRGYSLASALALLGLWLLSRNHLAATTVAIACLGAGALANEAAYVAFGVATLLLAARKRWVELVAVGGGLAFLLAWRVSVIGGLGGYAVATDRAGKVGTIALATWSTLLPAGLSTGTSVLPGMGFVAVSVAVLGALVAATAAIVRTPSSEPTTPAFNRPELWALAWLAGLTLVYVPNGVWFPRQVYMLLPPLAVLVGLLVGHGAVTGGAPHRWLARGAAGAVLLLTLIRAPYVQDDQQRVSWQQTDRVTRDLMRSGRGLPKGQEAVVVLPFARRGGQAALKAREGAQRRRQDPLGTRVSHQWAARRVGRRKIDLAAMYLHDPFHDGPEVTVEPVVGQPGTWRLTLTQSGSQWSVGSDLQGMVDGATLTLTVPDGAVLYVDDGDEGRVLSSD